MPVWSCMKLKRDYAIVRIKLKLAMRNKKIRQKYTIRLAGAASMVALLPGHALAYSCNYGTNPSPTDLQKCVNGDPITRDINTIVNFLGIGVGIVVIVTIILGGIQYSMAGDNAEAVSKAKQRIINGLLALAAFIFTYSILQWIIPGGIFK